MKSKAEIRNSIKKKREALDPIEKENLDKAIISKISLKLTLDAVDTILVYISHKNEVNIIDFIKKNIEKKHIVLPRVNGENLDLFVIETIDDLETGSFGIMEPKTSCRPIEPSSVNLAFIPGIAFDKKRHRIGFGKGFYDKLGKNLNCQKIGLAYDFQIVDEIPFESHDLPVDLIITN